MRLARLDRCCFVRKTSDGVHVCGTIACWTVFAAEIVEIVEVVTSPKPPTIKLKKERTNLLSSSTLGEGFFQEPTPRLLLAAIASAHALCCTVESPLSSPLRCRT